MDTIQRFRIDGVLGEGGMGTVYRAFDPELERAVAIKVLTAPTARLDGLDEHHTVDLRDGRPRTENEMLAEARMMAAISHPNVLPIFEVGRVGDKVFLVMELIDGIDLRRWLASGTRTVPEIVAVLESGARGLAAAHARGIVHGDFKPDNLLIGSDGRVCVADFGVSSFVQGPRASLVRVDGARGTPTYLAPEVWRGDPPTARSDVFAFAMTAAEALLGTLPPAPDTDEELAAIARSLDERGVPANVRDVIAGGLSREPSARPTELVAALAKVEPPVRKRRWLIPAIAGGALAAGAIGVIAMQRGEDAPSCTPVPHDDVWSPARAAELRAKSIPDVETYIALFDVRFADEAAIRLEVCRDRASGKLGSVQAASIVGCLDRTVIEYDERLKRSVAEIKNASYLLRNPPGFDDCRTRRDPPPGDLVKQRDLIARWIAAIGASKEDRRRELTALLPLALEIGDHEFAARVLGVRAGGLAEERDLAGSRTASEKARGYAQQSGSIASELRVLSEHMNIERFHDELAIARLLANDAKALLDRDPKTTVAERAMTEIASVATARGEYAEARDYGLRVLALLDASKRGATQQALDRRLQILRVTPEIDEPPPRDFLKFVEETHALLDQLQPDKTATAYRSGLFTVVEAYRLVGDPRAGPLWEQGLDLIRRSKPEPGGSELAHRAVLAGELFLRHRYDEAIDIMRAVVRESGRATSSDIAAANRRDEHLAILSLMLFAMNELAEAHTVAEDALLESTGKVGPTHKQTRKILDIVFSIELAQRDFERAEKHLEALDRAVQTAGDPAERAGVAVDRASLARERGDLTAAERFARQAVATLDEIKAKPTARQGAGRELGRVLVAMHREKEALQLLLDGIPAAERRSPHDAVAEFEIAKVERTLGKRAEADARARRSLDELKNLPGFAADRKAIEVWLAVR